jgi:transposase, IS30 family
MEPRADRRTDPKGEQAPHQPRVDERTEPGHWEIDTVLGKGRPCIATLVERSASYLSHSSPLPFHTITANNGTEFHGYKQIEEETGTCFYFANPHHSWERGTSQNTHGLVRQYVPKRKSMGRVT